MTERDLRLIITAARRDNIDLSISEILSMKRLPSNCASDIAYSGFTFKGKPILVTIHVDAKSIIHVFFN